MGRRSNEERLATRRIEVHWLLERGLRGKALQEAADISKSYAQNLVRLYAHHELWTAWVRGHFSLSEALARVVGRGGRNRELSSARNAVLSAATQVARRWDDRKDAGDEMDKLSEAVAELRRLEAARR